MAIGLAPKTKRWLKIMQSYVGRDTYNALLPQQPLYGIVWHYRLFKTFYMDYKCPCVIVKSL